jgi:DNA-directed RNA polymerase subunit M/transcription elongation factor TFIIS
MPKEGLETSALSFERKQIFREENTLESANRPLPTVLTFSENEELASHHTFVTSFCPKCEALLELAHGKSAEVYCRKCKYRAKVQQKRVLERKIDASNNIRKEIAVLDSEESKLRTFPVVHAICSECNNDVSETWTMAIGSEGTAGVTFLRCTVCGHTRREAE